MIVDTSVWVDFFRGSTNASTVWPERRIPQQRLGLTDLILCEVLQGLRDDLVFSHVRRELDHFHIHDTGGSSLAIQAAENYRLLCAKGLTIRGTVDTMIATFCLIRGHTLLHNDRDFDHFERHLGLNTVRPIAH